MTPPDDLPSPKGLACDSLLKRAKEEAMSMPYEVEIKRQAVLGALWDVVEAAKVLQANVGRTTGPMYSALDRALAALSVANTSTTAALESDRALLRRSVEVWDIIIKTQPPFAQASSMLQAVIDEARARVGEK